MYYLKLKFIKDLNLQMNKLNIELNIIFYISLYKTY